jgi:hypothetical protein
LDSFINKLIYAALPLEACIVSDIDQPAFAISSQLYKSINSYTLHIINNLASDDDNTRLVLRGIVKMLFDKGKNYVRSGGNNRNSRKQTKPTKPNKAKTR